MQGKRVSPSNVNIQWNRKQTVLKLLRQKVHLRKESGKSMMGRSNFQKRYVSSVFAVCYL
jgi:hypothetical protein